MTRTDRLVVAAITGALVGLILWAVSRWVGPTGSALLFAVVFGYAYARSEEGGGGG